MSIAKKLGLAISPLVVLSVFLVIFSYQNVKQIQEEIPNISEFAMISVELVNNANNAFDRQSRYYEDVVFMHDLEMLSRAKQASEEIATYLIKLKQLNGISRETQEVIDVYMAKIKHYSDSAERVYEQMSGDENFLENPSNALAVKNLGETKSYLESVLRGFSDRIRNDLAQNMESVNNSAKRRNNINAIISSIIIGSSVLIIFWLIERAVTRPMVETNRRLRKAMEALWGEMELAKKIQTCLLPTCVKSLHPDFDIAAAMVTADEVGGDFYEIIQDKGGSLWIAIGDVSGHGVTPGLIMMMAQTIHATVVFSLDCDARNVVIKINEILYLNVHERLKENHFMSFIALKYLGEGRFQHAGAHLSIVIYRHQAQACELVRTKGVYLNLKQDISRAIKNDEFVLEPGDTLVLYTDGLTEAKNKEGALLDIEGFVSIVEEHIHHDVETMKEMIISDVFRWCDNKPLDDMSLIVIRRKGVLHG